MLKLTLTKRPAKIGKSINTRTEMHGTDEVPGLDIPITGILINEEELALLCDEPTAHAGLYKKDGSLGVVPRIAAFTELAIDHKFENATVRMTGSSIEAATFSGAKIKSIKLGLQPGGLTLVHFTLQVNPENGIDVPKLLNAKISIGIKSAELEEDGAGEEPELPLEHSTPEVLDAMREEEEATASAMGRKIGNADKKAKRKVRRDVN
jgi:hypothetical protein